VRTEGGNAFTLIEILVSLVVLSLIVLIVAQIFSTSSAAISQTSKNMNALDASEAVLQQIGLDVSRMVIRNDVDYSFVKNDPSSAPPLNDSLSFYARTTGLNSTGAPSTGIPRSLCVVKYQVVQNATTKLLELDYGAQQIDWDNSGSNPFVVTSATQLLTTPNTLPVVAASSLTTLAPEVIRMETCFVMANDPAGNTPPKLLTNAAPAYISYNPTGTTTLPSPQVAVPYPIQNLAGVLVGIIVIDPKSRQLLPNGVDMKVAQLFPDSVANQDLLSLWTPFNTASKLEALGVPVQAVAGVRIYQKYFPLPR
jgi:prepilin-type N-terminal cleavage/methylation domain-containing protein